MGNNVMMNTCYPHLPSIRTGEGKAYFSVEGVMNAIGLNDCEFQSLLEGEYDDYGIGFQRNVYDRFRNDFPAPVQFDGEDYWRFDQVMEWKRTEARIQHKIETYLAEEGYFSDY